MLGLVVVWVQALVWLDRWRQQAPRPTWDAFGVWLFARVYVSLMHRARFENVEPIRAWAAAQRALPPQEREPLIVAPNHTAGIDPVLIQTIFPVEIRWMMMRRMNVGFVTRFTEYLRIILVDQTGSDTAALREGIRHLRSGGVLGVFPEGGLERPPRQLRPFQTGVGLLALRTGAAVLPVWVSGTPEADTAMQSLLRRSRSRVVFGEIRRFDPKATTPEDIRIAVQAAIARMSGWPVAAPSDDEPGDLARTAAGPASDPSEAPAPATRAPRAVVPSGADAPPA